MDLSTVNHLLIGLPGSGKSTFAEVLASLDDNAVIISSDRVLTQMPNRELYRNQAEEDQGSEIETHLLKQTQAAIAQGKTVIYDGTNAQRAHRLDWLKKVEAIVGSSHHWVAWYLQTSPDRAKQWNQARDRAIPEEMLHRMRESLDKFPPHRAEGFLKVEKIDVSDSEMAKIEARHVIANLNRSLIQQRNQSNKYQLHRYSHLLDFERLMHLLSLILQYPGIGNLRETAPETAQNLLQGVISDSADDLAEIQTIMARLKGRVYGDRDAIAADLEWLEINGFLGTGDVEQELKVDQLSEEELVSIQQRSVAWHRYSDLERFQRLLTLIRYLVHHPFPGRREQGSASSSQQQSHLQQRFFQAMQNDGVLVGYTLASVREDIRRVLKPYQLFPDFTMKKGYFCGTGIFSQRELAKIYGLLHSQQVYLDDPVAVETAKTFRERIESSRLLDIKQIYPSRAIGNREIVNTESLPKMALPKQLDVLEGAIEAGEKLELALTPGSARFPGQPALDRFQAYPLQVVFHNIAWYLGFERVGGDKEKKGLLCFERLDRLTLEQRTGQSRSFQSQLESLGNLKKLYTASAGIFLGNQVSNQIKYLSKDKQECNSVKMTVELRMTEQIFKFVSEGNQRFPKSQMQMTRRWDQASQETDQSIFCLPESKDPDFPYRFRVTLPIWSIHDVDLKRWILGFGRQIKVAEPAEFRQKIAGEVEATWKNYLEDY